MYRIGEAGVFKIASIFMLTPEQVIIVKKQMVQNGVPVRFQINGQTMNISTGELQPKGINIINQLVYWNFSKDTSKQIAEWLYCKAVFSE